MKDRNTKKSFNRVQRMWKSEPEYWVDPWQYYVRFIGILKDRGVKFITMSQALGGEYDEKDINVILDHHIDHYPIETEIMCRWELEACIVSTIYLFNNVLRTHPVLKISRWSIEDIDIAFYQSLEKSGFEIGYHQNALGQVRSNQDVSKYDTNISQQEMDQARDVFKNDVDNLRQYFNIRTFIPHGGGESNSLLKQLPEGYEDSLVWVYNGAKNKRPVKWLNYSDSCGQITQVVRAYEAHYFLQVDNLHIKAYLLTPGLHHVLVHPGRFGKGMPAEYYKSGWINEKETSLQLTFDYPSAISLLPVDVSKIIGEWERDVGKKARLNAWERKADYSGDVPDHNEKYYVLSDNLELLRNHMASNPLCVPCFAIYQKMTQKQKAKQKRDRHLSHIPISFPIPPDPETHNDQVRVDDIFGRQFSAYYNKLYSHRMLEHLVNAGLVYDYLVLTNLEIKRKREIRDCFLLLRRCKLESRFVFLKINAKLFYKTWQNVLKKYPDSEQVLSAYNIEIQKNKFQKKFSLIIKSKCSSINMTGRVSFRQLIDENHEFRMKFKGNLIPYSSLTLSSEMSFLQLNAKVSEKIFKATISQADINIWRKNKGDQDGLDLLSEFCNVSGASYAKRFRMYKRFVNRNPSPDLLYEYLLENQKSIFNNAECNKARGAMVFAWAWAYLAKASLVAYEATEQERFLEYVLDGFEFVKPYRDILTGQEDVKRKRILNAWGSSFYTEYARGKGYDIAGDNGLETWNCTISTNGRIIYPIAWACKLIKENSELRSKYRAKADEYISIMNCVADEFLSEFYEDNKGGGYFWRVDRNEKESFNHQNIFGEALLMLSQLSDKIIYREIAQKLALYFKNTMTIDKNGAYVWGYKPPGEDMKRSQLIEDIGHAQLNIQFVLSAYEAGLVFTDEDIRRVVNTFCKNIYRGNREFIGGISPDRSSVELKPSYPGHFAALISLAKYDSRVKEIVEAVVGSRPDLYPENWFSDKITSIGYAYRLSNNE